MAKLLYLVHRIPFPPNKGDKVRSFHLLKHLLQTHEVHLGTFIDDPDDEQYVEHLRSLCSSLHIERLNPRLAKLRSLRGLLHGEALTLNYYQNAGLQAWVDQLCATQAIDAAIIFSSSMVQYIEHHRELPVLIDFVDVDSAKWTAYAPQHAWPLSWLYRREGQRLLAYERQTAHQARQSFFVTAQETALFTRFAPECAGKVSTSCNGVDSDFFSPHPARQSPFPSDEIPLVFTGAMDYWPNIDAASWWVKDIFPKLLASTPQLRFYIVGRSPTAEVLGLASERVVVTGTVDDVRPYLQFAHLVVAPLRVARGIQNKILEAMAMGRPVIASQSCVDVLSTGEETAVLAAQREDDFIRQTQTLLDNPQSASAIGEAGRNCVLRFYSWQAQLEIIDKYLPPLTDAAG